MMLHPHLPAPEEADRPRSLEFCSVWGVSGTSHPSLSAPLLSPAVLQGQPSARPGLPKSCGGVGMGGRAESFRTKPLCLLWTNTGSAAAVDAWEDPALWERCSLPHHTKIYCLGGKCFAGGMGNGVEFKVQDDLCCCLSYH